MLQIARQKEKTAGVPGGQQDLDGLPQPEFTSNTSKGEQVTPCLSDLQKGKPIGQDVSVFKQSEQVEKQHLCLEMTEVSQNANILLGTFKIIVLN